MHAASQIGFKFGYRVNTVLLMEPISGHHFRAMSLRRVGAAFRIQTFPRSQDTSSYISFLIPCVFPLQAFPSVIITEKGNVRRKIVPVKLCSWLTFVPCSSAGSEPTPVIMDGMPRLFRSLRCHYPIYTGTKLYAL